LLNNASDTMTGLLTTTGGLITSASITINSDTSRLYMGATADASTYFDGTDWWFVSPTESKKASDIGSGSGAGGWVGTATSNLDMAGYEIISSTGTVGFGDDYLITSGGVTFDGDNVSAVFGASADASIYFDGVNGDLYIDLDTSVSPNAVIVANGTFEIKGTGNTIKYSTCETSDPCGSLPTGAGIMITFCANSGGDTYPCYCDESGTDLKPDGSTDCF